MPMPDSDNRLLLVLPSWVGDAVMATPALVRVREAFPGAYIGAMARPGIDRLLEGVTTPGGQAVIDEFHVLRPTGVLGPKHAAAKIRPRRYGRALLFTGSFSTALTVRVAGVPSRIGYDRDGRGFLLTKRLKPPRAQDGPRAGSWAVVPAVSYYWHAAGALIEPGDAVPLVPPPLDDPLRASLGVPDEARMRLGISAADRDEAAGVRTSAGISGATAILNPGGNNPAKRWPADRFALLADHLAQRHGLTVLLNGSPAEAELCRRISEGARSDPIVLPEHGSTLGALKALAADSAVMVTNDTGPRHIAAAVGTPVVGLFGPTDPRWTTLPVPEGREEILVADPTLPASEITNDHPERCAIDRIGLEDVIVATDRVLASSRSAAQG